MSKTSGKNNEEKNKSRIRMKIIVVTALTASKLNQKIIKMSVNQKLMKLIYVLRFDRYTVF